MASKTIADVKDPWYDAVLSLKDSDESEYEQCLIWWGI